MCVLLSGMDAEVETRALESQSIRFMSWEEPENDLFVSSIGGVFKQVKAPAYRLGPEVELAASEGEVRLFQLLEREGSTTYESVIECPLSSEIRRYRGYLMRDDREVTPPRILILGDDVAQFPVGQVRVVNFSKFDSIVRIGDRDPFLLAPMEWKQVSVDPDMKYRVFLKVTSVRDDYINRYQVLSRRPNHRGHVMIVHTTKSFSQDEESSDSAQLRILTEVEYIVPDSVNGW